MLQDRIARKPWWQVGFNIGQYTLSLTAAAAVLKLAGGYGALHANGYTPTDLLTVMGAAAAYFSVNLLLVTRATTLYQGIPFARALQTDITFGLSVGAVLLCLAPVVVTVLQFSRILSPRRWWACTSADGRRCGPRPPSTSPATTARAAQTAAGS